MKRTYIPLLVLMMIAMIVIPPQQAKAQNVKGQSVGTAGVGVSLVGLLYSAVKNSVNSQAGASLQLHSTPVLIGSYDYAIADHFSLGGAFSYQQFSSDYVNYQYVNSNHDTVVASFTDVVKRINFGVRPLFHFGNTENFDPYFGARISYTNWSYSTNNPDRFYDLSSAYKFIGASPIKFQVLFGIHYFFGEMLGINTELAFGPSYYLMGGMSFKFGGVGGNAPRK